MLTYITGEIFISAIAEGMARQIFEKGETVKVFFFGASKEDILAAAEDHSHVIVCWRHCLPLDGLDPDCLIRTVHPVTIVKAPENITEVFGDSTHIGTFSVPPSRFSQPSINISLVSGDGEYRLNQQSSESERA
ncbi:MAG: hypothetical protein VR65_24890 [Desulfobulbaceae bacterium BRH_c16a]|nr:MAG: hypothetical protein VR65_24890 [Desulfobulbaceae bacterium BRH_c16a]